MTDWQRIEAEARDQVRADLDVLEQTPLQFGEPIAWSECRFGLTNGLGVVHRVGYPQHDQAYTTCGEIIPEPIRWIPLSPRLIKSLGECRYCRTECERLSREHAA